MKNCGSNDPNDHTSRLIGQLRQKPRAHCRFHRISPCPNTSFNYRAPKQSTGCGYVTINGATAICAVSYRARISAVPCDSDVTQLIYLALEVEPQAFICPANTLGRCSLALFALLSAQAHVLADIGACICALLQCAP